MTGNPEVTKQVSAWKNSDLCGLFGPGFHSFGPRWDQKGSATVIPFRPAHWTRFTSHESLMITTDDGRAT